MISQNLPRRRQIQPRPGELITSGKGNSGRVEIERVLARVNGHWQVLDSRGKLNLIGPTGTSGVWLRQEPESISRTAPAPPIMKV